MIGQPLSLLWTYSTYVCRVDEFAESSISSERNVSKVNKKLWLSELAKDVVIGYGVRRGIAFTKWVVTLYRISLTYPYPYSEQGTPAVAE